MKASLFRRFLLALPKLHLSRRRLRGRAGAALRVILPLPGRPEPAQLQTAFRAQKTARLRALQSAAAYVRPPAPALRGVRHLSDCELAARAGAADVVQVKPALNSVRLTGQAAHAGDRLCDTGEGAVSAASESTPRRRQSS